MAMETQGPAPLSHGDRLALDRTRLAYERTLLAWVRTATSMISFGFTVYKFFEYLRENERIPFRHGLAGPRNFALFMIGLGLATLLLATLQHALDMRHLKTEYGPVPRSLAMLL